MEPESYQTSREMAGLLHGDRRRSHRIPLGSGLSVEVGDVGTSRLMVLSLGGATLEMRRKPRIQGKHSLQLEYEGVSVQLVIEIYTAMVKELFYSDGVESKVSYRSRGRFCDPSVEALNLLYRIMKEHWCDPAQHQAGGTGSAQGFSPSNPI